MYEKVNIKTISLLLSAYAHIVQTSVGCQCPHMRIRILKIRAVRVTYRVRTKESEWVFVLFVYYWNISELPRSTSYVYF